MNYVTSEPNGKLDWVLEMLMAFITGCIIGAVTVYSCTKQSTPVENTAKIDSLITVNDSIYVHYRQSFRQARVHPASHHHHSPPVSELLSDRPDL